MWSKIGDNAKDDAVKLNAYYVLMLEKMPTRPPEANVVRVRVRLAEQVYANAPQLGNVQATIEDMIGYGKVLGMSDAPVGRDRELLTVGGLPRLTAADNDCTFCDAFDCQSNLLGGPLKCICRHDSTFDVTRLTPGACIRCKMARAYHKEHPTIDTLKGVTFTVNRVTGSGGNNSVQVMMADQGEEHGDPHGSRGSLWACPHGRPTPRRSSAPRRAAQP